MGERTSISRFSQFFVVISSQIFEVLGLWAIFREKLYATIPNEYANSSSWPGMHLKTFRSILWVTKQESEDFLSFSRVKHLTTTSYLNKLRNTEKDGLNMYDLYLKGARLLRHIDHISLFINVPAKCIQTKNRGFSRFWLNYNLWRNMLMREGPSGRCVVLYC